jgi:hypothetical protein
LASVDISSVSAIRAGARTSALVSDDIAAVASVSGRADLTGQAALDAGATAGVTGWAQLSSRAQVLGLFDGYAQTVAEAGTSVAPTADYIATSAIRAGAQTSAVAELLTDATASIKSEAAVSGRSDIEEDRVISAVGRAQTSAYVTGDWAIPASISGRASTSAVATLDTPAITSVRCGAVASIISDRTVRVGTKSIGQARTSAVTQSLGPFDAVGQITGRASISSAIGTTGLSIEGVVQLVGRAVAVANPYILVSGTGTVPTEALTGVDTGPSFPTEARGPYGAFAIRIDAKSTSARFCDEDTVASAFENIRSVKAEFEG